MTISDFDGTSLHDRFLTLRRAKAAHGGLSLDARRLALKRLRTLVQQKADDFSAAIDQDFGGRSRHETLLTEIAVVLAAIDHALPRLKRWSRSERVSVGWRFWPARGRIVKVPLGVVGVLSPWNYPVQLALLPLVGALSAGCRVLLKPSELAPATAAVIAESLAEAFDPSVVSVATGGPEVAEALSRLPLDGLLFTGSTNVGRKVMAAAAEGLVPVTLELGGKSPAIIDDNIDLDEAASSIVAGKLLNAGQTCIAPDYVLVPRHLCDAFVVAAQIAARRLYPHPDGPDYTSVRGSEARQRLVDLQQGLHTIPLFDRTLDEPKLTPVIVLNPPPDSAIMREEIFGPILPVLAYDHMDEALAVLRGLPSPLALYWFGRDRRRLAAVLRNTSSGAVCVNDTVVHAAVESLPFGGVGASGIGAYHGRAGFDAFTHRRPIFMQSRWTQTRLLRPPYGPLSDRILKLLLR